MIAMGRATKAEIDERMKKGGIPGLTAAYLNPQNEVPIEPLVSGTTDIHANNPHELVTPDTVFGVASLSKPVFSYLVLRLIADKKLTCADGSSLFDLDTPIAEILPQDGDELQKLFNTVFNPEDTSDRAVGDAFIEKAKQLTPRMILSHTTGIPIHGAPRFDFEPGTQYAYGNYALSFLQKAIEHKTGKSLDILAQTEVFTPLKMNNSSYLPPTKEYSLRRMPLNPKELSPSEMFELCEGKPSYVLFDSQLYYIDKAVNIIKEINPLPGKEKELKALFTPYSDESTLATQHDLITLNSLTGHPPSHMITPQPSAANSVHTTATDYARLMSAWMNDPNETMQEAFEPQISLTVDQWAIDIMGDAEKDKQDRQHLAWGLCFGLQLDDTGKKVNTAFHSGDMNQWQGWVAMDVAKKTAVVYLANGDDALKGSGNGYGHVLADVIVKPEVELTHGLNWFFKKFGFSRDVEPGWKEKLILDTDRIDTYVKACNASPLKPIAETSEITAARARIKQFRGTLQDAKQSNASSTKDVDVDKTAEGKKISTPCQIKPKFPGEIL